MLNAKKQRALAEVMRNPTRKQAATAAGISERTLRGYFNDPAFLEEYRIACRAVIDEAACYGRQLINDAVAVLLAVMENPAESGAARIAAAGKLIDYALKLTEQADINNQIAELQRKVYGATLF